jgi:CDP-paratose 2-epimerase
MKILVTGSGGLIGSYVVEHYSNAGHEVIGIDNNMREVFFGPEASTKPVSMRLSENLKNFTHNNIDIRDEQSINALFLVHKFDVIIHCAAQPSHDKASHIPIIDFDTNARATMILLEAFRNYCPSGIFIFLSTNKVYGDTPNYLSISENPTRFEFTDDHYKKGIDENMRIDSSMHSLFGVSKLSADLMVQEYGKYFNLNTVCFRGGCLTGPRHSSVKLHGFLSFLIKSNMSQLPYTVFGYKGKQVRDQIHAIDVVRAFDLFIKNPKKAAVYNLGGGFSNSASILELDNLIYKFTGKKTNFTFSNEVRLGDHKCYYTDMSKFENDYPDFFLSFNIEQIVLDIVTDFENKLK